MCDSNGGIIPPIAQDLHRQNIEDVVNEAVTQAGISFKDIDAIATTVKPGTINLVNCGFSEII